MNNAIKISQIKFDKEFLTKLLSKLTVGNGRSIHLNAVPGRLKSRIDLFDLSQHATQTNGALDFLNKLLTKDKFSFAIGWDEKSKTKMSYDEKDAIYQLSKRLDTIVSDNEELFLETGIKNFGFGYPLLVRPDSKNLNKIIISPVFIWSLDIKKSSIKNEWIISKSDDNPIKVNEMLISHLENDAGIQLQSLTSDVLDDNILSKDEIIDYLSNELFKKLNIGEKISEISLAKCPEKKKLESITTSNPWIQWSGIFGLYRSHKEPIIEATREILEKIEEFNTQELEIEPFQTTSTASFDLDPSQSEIINTLNNDEFKIIQGPPGTGKSQAISAIISNALANGAKTLVVCEKKTALDVLASNLEKAKLDTFCIVVDDVTKDRSTVVRKARDLETDNPYIGGYDNDLFEQTYAKFIQIRNEVNASFNESSRPIFADQNWTEIVGSFLKYSKSEYFDSIKDRFAKLKIKYTSEEFGKYLGKIRQGTTIFQQIEDINDTDFYLLDMNQFGDSISIRDRKEILAKIAQTKEILHKAEAFVNKSNYTIANFSISSDAKDVSNAIKKARNLSEISQKAANLASQNLTSEILTEINKTLKTLNHDYTKIPCSTAQIDIDIDLPAKINLSNEIIEQIEHAKETYNHGLSLSQEDFNNKKTNFFKSLFSSSAAQATRDIRDINATFDGIKSLLENLGNLTNISVDLKSWDDYSTISDIITDLDKSHNQVSDFITQTKTEISAAIDTVLHNKNVIKEFQIGCETILKCKDFIQKTDNDLSTIFPRIDKLSKSYQSLETYNTTLTAIKHDLDILDKNLDRLDSYNNWIKYRDSEKSLFGLMSKTPAELWEELYKGAFFYNFLLEFESNSKSGLPRNDSKLKLLRNLYNDLQQQNVKRIYHHWYIERDRAIDSIDDKYGFKALFALKKTQKFGKKLSLRQIIDKDFDNFTSLFPVIMVNPNVANALLPLRQGLFDLVIFDEASQLRVEDVFAAMIRGKYKIIAGDKHQMPPANYFAATLDGNTDDSDEEEEYNEENQIGALARSGMLDAESLLEFTDFLKDKNMSYLDFHYRSKHPALIEFSNASFYGGNLCPLPVNGNEYIPISFIEVNGLYENGKEKNVNKDEAAAVLKIVEEITPDTNGEYPSLGIATFNIHQKRLIHKALFDRAQSDEAFQQKFDKLQANGLFVKNLESIQGDERDIIIISTTFGRDDKGRFSQNFGGISGQNGYKLLNVLVTRAKQRMFVVTSIPETYYSRYTEEIGAKQQNNGRGILYAYLSYAKAISENNAEKAESVLSFLRQYTFDKQNRHANNTGLSDSIFEEEVRNEISTFIDPSLIKQQHRVGGYKLDFFIDIKGHKIALECDGRTYHGSEQAYMADMHRQKQIEQFGYEFYRIWSTDWFEDKDRELLKFRRFIENLS